MLRSGVPVFTVQWPNSERLLSRVVRERWEEYPSDLEDFPENLWSLSAIRYGRNLLKAWGPDVVLGIAHPFVSLVVASSIAEYAGIPWVAQFHPDGGGAEPQAFPKWLSAKRDELEDIIISGASHVTSASSELSIELAARFFRDVTYVDIKGEAQLYLDLLAWIQKVGLPSRYLPSDPWLSDPA